MKAWKFSSDNFRDSGSTFMAHRIHRSMSWLVFFCPLLALVLATPVLIFAQTPIRIGILVQEMERSQTQGIKGLGEEFKRLGYEEKKDLFFEIRNAKGNRGALQSAAAELLARRVNAIFTTGTSATRAAIAATAEIPIVFVHPDDPAAAGFVKSNGERAKNLTGVAAYARGTTEKRVELIKEIVPGLRKLLIFYDVNNAFSRDSFGLAEAVAKKFSLETIGYGLKSTDEFRTTVASLSPMQATAIFQIPDELFESESEFFFETARAKKFPTMFNQEAWAIAGALAAYGPNYLEMGRQAGRLIQKIINGEKPSALSIERAGKFDLTLNYRTARFLDIKFSPAMLKAAEKVIR